MKKKFRVIHLDTMGQGVCKETVGPNNLITFISKVLPGEEGECICTQKKGKVQFAYITGPAKVSTPSPDRIEAACEHYDQCPSCAYLHTPYEKEIEFKKQSLAHHFRRFEYDCEIVVQKSETRDHYRNRVQLHYDLKLKKLGAISRFLKTIVPIPNCLLPHPKVKEQVERLYQNDAWMKEAKKFKRKTRGHVEVYYRADQNKVSVNWNRPYADEGFTQVHDEMNKLMLQRVKELSTEYVSDDEHIIDLFGGRGNLSKGLPGKISVIDASDYKNMPCENQTYYRTNIYKADPRDLAIDKCDFMIIDPPRSGLRNIKEWTDHFGVQKLLYISCDPATLTRDMQSLINTFKIDHVELIDLFPSTYHYESLVILSRI